MGDPSENAALAVERRLTRVAFERLPVPTSSCRRERLVKCPFHLPGFG